MNFNDLSFINMTEVLGFPSLMEFLQSGQRMEKPEYAPQVIGKVMSECWKENPDERATFAQLEEILGQLVNENAYVNLSSQATKDFENMHRHYENLTNDLPSMEIMDLVL